MKLDGNILAKFAKGKKGNETINYHGLNIPQYSLLQLIDDIGLDIYQYLIQFCSLTVEKLLWEEKFDDINFDEIEFYDLLSTEGWLQQYFHEFLKVFIKCDGFKTNINYHLIDDNNLPTVDFIIQQNENTYVIMRDNFEEFREFFRIMYRQPNINDDDINKAYDKLAYKTMRSINRKQRKLNELLPVKYDLLSIVNGISCNSYGYNKTNIWDLTIYQLYDELYGILSRDNWSFCNLGIYTGNIDGNKIKMDDIVWYNKTNN